MALKTKAKEKRDKRDNAIKEQYLLLIKDPANMK